MASPRAIEEEMICAITRELPVDPVTARDGRVYEREAILRHFEGKPDNQITSPLTNEIIGKDLLAAPQTRNSIEILIEKGVIIGELAKRWVEKKEMDDLIRKAENGDEDAIDNVAANYWFGQNGFEEDKGRAYVWSKRARVAGSVIGTAILGATLTEGADGVPQDPILAAAYLSEASALGSNYAAFVLGSAWLYGSYGFARNVDEALAHFERAIRKNCAFDHMPESLKEEAQTRLDELKTCEEEDSNSDPTSVGGSTTASEGNDDSTTINHHIYTVSPASSYDSYPPTFTTPWYDQPDIEPSNGGMFDDAHDE